LPPLRLLGKRISRPIPSLPFRDRSKCKQRSIYDLSHCFRNFGHECMMAARDHWRRMRAFNQRHSALVGPTCAAGGWIVWGRFSTALWSFQSSTSRSSSVPATAWMSASREPASSPCIACIVLAHGSALPLVGARCRGQRSGSCRSRGSGPQGRCNRN